MSLRTLFRLLLRKVWHVSKQIDDLNAAVPRVQDAQANFGDSHDSKSADLDPADTDRVAAA